MDPAARAWRLMGAVLALLALLFVLAASAQAEDCQPGADGSPGDYGYNAACGPEYESPGWGNAGGWTDPSQYSTIKLADITGDGQDELLARSSDGLEIWRFDRTLGEWRPAIGADGFPEVLRDFRSPLPNESPGSHGTNPMVYSTLQAVQVLGNGTESIVAQFHDGTHTYDYVPPAGTKSIDGGKWLREPVSGPSGDLPPSDYLNMQVIPVTPNVTPATLVYQDAYYVHSGPGTPGGGNWDATGRTTLAPVTTDPRYYLDNRAAVWHVRSSGTGTLFRNVDLYRTRNGIGWQIYDPQGWVCSQYGTGACTYGWSGRGADVSGGPFPDTDSTQYGCVTENFNCFGTSPDFYETLQVANNLRGFGDPNGYVLGRLSDGLHVYASSDGDTWDTSIPVLTALKDPDNAPYTPPPGTWSSIRTGDITGDGRTDVLALIDGRLKAWELKPDGSGGWAWNELPADVPLNLGQTYENNASYYSTIQVGPVAGDGYPDAVIARGPFGIRTWFYCTGSDSSKVPACLSAGMRGKSGWTSWLAPGGDSYPQFSGGQAAAWSALNALAKEKLLLTAGESSVRDVWTGTNAPTDIDLGDLRDGLVVLANCAGETSATPPTYTSCTPPAGTSGFTAADWTAVVNETFKEIYDARQVLAYFSQADALRADAFLAEGAELPAIGSALAPLNGAAANPVSISPLAAVSAGVGIAGSLASVLLPESPAIGAAVGVASYIISAIAAATPAVDTPPFYGTYADVQTRFAEAVGQAQKALTVQSQEVRQSWALSQLVAQLTGPGGAWHNVDAVGLKSSMEQGLAVWAYKTLLPTMYDRYVITGCAQNNGVICLSKSFAGQVGSGDDFTTLQPPPDGYWYDDTGAPAGNPCYFHEAIVAGPSLTVCKYESPPADSIANQVWGTLSPSCNYDGDSLTQWTFGCNLGVRPQDSVGAEGGMATGWQFTTCYGNPVVSAPIPPPQPFVQPLEGRCENPSGTASVGATGTVELTTSTWLPSGFKVTSATLPANRALYEPGFGDLLSPTDSTDTNGLTSAGPGQLGAIDLTVDNGGQSSGSGGTLLGSSPGEPPASLKLTGNPGTGSSQATRMELRLTGLQVALPEACQRLPTSVSMTSPQFTLDTSLELTDGQSTQTVSIPTEWECVYSRSGQVTGLRTVTPQAPAQRPGLAVSISGPRHVHPGSLVTYTVRVRNDRRGPRDRDISSLWNVETQTALSATDTPANAEFSERAPVTARLAELPRNSSKTLQVRIRIPAAARTLRRVCVSVLATADSARPASAEACAAIRTRRGQ